MLFLALRRQKFGKNCRYRQAEVNCRQRFAPAARTGMPRFRGAGFSRPRSDESDPTDNLEAIEMIGRTMNFVRLLILLLGFLPLSLLARQEAGPVKAVVEDFLRVQTKGLPGRVTSEVGAIEALNNLPPCDAFEAFLPSGARLWGRSTVGVRCVASATWSLFVKVQVRVYGSYLVAAHNLSQGQVVSAADVAAQEGDLAELPGGILTEVNQAVGRTMTMGISAGRPLRSDNLRAVMAIQQGQSVKVISGGSNFQVSTEGKALNSATAGQVAQVRLSSGQVLSGIARPGGVVEIKY